MDLRAAAEEQLAAVAIPSRLGPAGRGNANAGISSRHCVGIDVELARLVRRIRDETAIRRKGAEGLIERGACVRLRLRALARRKDPQIIACAGGAAADQQLT